MFLLSVFKWHLLLVMEIAVREINSDLVVIPEARKSQLQVLDIGNSPLKTIWRLFSDYFQSRAHALAPAGKLKPSATGFIRGLGKCRSCGKIIADLHAMVGETEDSLF